VANYNIADIEGIGPVYAKKLKNAKIRSVNAFLEIGKNRQGRKEIATKTGIDEGMILKWINFADLYRIKGIGSEYSELLEKAGVDTVKELAKRVPENLQTKMAQVNRDRKIVRAVPGIKSVKKWVEQAKRLKPFITY
jgi:predicted flap endonuclease-1-like 5' DNA nuclease